MLEYRHVSVSCQRTPVLEDISVSFPAGKITVIVGPNGCGKTTLLQCLNGVSQVTGGSIFLKGQDYLKLSPRERARTLSFLPQVRTIIPALPVKTLVEHGRFPYLGFARKKSPKDMAIVRHAMEFAQVSEYAHQYVDTLSGGVRQRVFFAMALAQDCNLMVLDEPTTYLDLPGQKEFLHMLEILREEGKTIILTLHDLNHAVRIADQLVVMGACTPTPQGRKIAAWGAPGDCLKRHILEEVFHTKYKKFEDQEGAYYFFI
ncbi:Fe(3+) dicitrate transport ATP-binding protein FecE [Lachnospiraceae bacterium]|nr:Fe(3+) dicitrate transport ATP-binding protein FecE [Lachnospiraceae bacterium]